MHFIHGVWKCMGGIFQRAEESEAYDPESKSE